MTSASGPESTELGLASGPHSEALRLGKASWRVGTCRGPSLGWRDVRTPPAPFPQAHAIALVLVLVGLGGGGAGPGQSLTSSGQAVLRCCACEHRGVCVCWEQGKDPHLH